MKDDRVRECRFAFYTKSKFSNDDLHLVKEAVHEKDGTVTPNVRLVKNFKRTFGVTKKGFQNHKSKKEWELLDRLNTFESTQVDLEFNVKKALGTPWLNGGMRDIAISPYLYGTDIDSTALIKQKYIDHYNVDPTFYSVSVFDTETDVLHNTDQIMMATISFKDKVYTAVQSRFVKGYANPVERVKQLADIYIGDVIKARNITLEVEIVEDEITVVRETIKRAHMWKPDFLAAWNMLFDIEKVVEACHRAGVKPEDILNDPSIPEHYRYFNLKVGPAKKVTNSGVVQVFKPAQRWHTVNSPASFYWIDAMASYRGVRAGSAEEPSYGLDAILQKNLKIQKLKFKEADAYKGLEWHKFMQAKYPLEYIVYNIFDCVCVEMLDEKTLDLALSVPLFSGCSDFSKFNSQPRRKVDALHHVCLKHGRMIGSTSSEMVEDFDKMTTSLDGWIVMLPSERVTESGLKIIREDPNLRTNIRIGVSD